MKISVKLGHFLLILTDLDVLVAKSRSEPLRVYFRIARAPPP